MVIRRIQTCLLLALGLGTWGCAENGQIDWRAENPFQNYQEQSSEIFIVTCQFQQYILPADLDLSDLSFWSESFEQMPDPTIALSAGTGFPADQVRLWRENGLIVRVAPLSDLDGLRQSIIYAGGMAGEQATNWFRNPLEVADYPGFALMTPTTIFIYETAGAVRSHELPQGVGVFRLYCQPWQNNPQNKIMNIKISPQLHLPSPPVRYEFDETYQLQLVMDQPRVVFEQLTLSGRVPLEYFICIACRPPEQRAAGTLGELFLKRAGGADNYQLVFVIVPSMRIGTEVKNDR